MLVVCAAKIARDAAEPRGAARSAAPRPRLPRSAQLLKRTCTLWSADVLDRVDYLSCVSGGSGAGALLLANAFISHTSAGGKEHTSPPQTPPSARPKPSGHGAGRRDAASSKMWAGADGAQPSENAGGEAAGAPSCSGSAATVELVLQQLRRQCARNSKGAMLLVVQLLVMIVILVMVMPLMAAAGATLAAASVTDAIGDTLHSLLTQGFHPLQLAAVVVFFGPIWTGLCCFVSALATHEQDMAGVHGPALSGAHVPTPMWAGLRKVAAVSVAGQVAAMCSTLMAALFCMLLMMLLEERLLTQTIMDEVLLLVIWISWSAVSIRTLVAPDRRLLTRERNMLSSIQMGVAVGGLWLASRACAEHVMRRQGSMAYSSACLWLLVVVLAHDLLMAAVHLLFRRRLRSAFLCTPGKSKSNSSSTSDLRPCTHAAAAPAALDASEDCGGFTFSLAEFDNPRGGVTGLPLNAGARCGASAETSTQTQPQSSHMLSAHVQSIFSRASRSAFADTRETALHTSLSRYAYVSKETCLYSQRGLFVWPKEAYLYDQRGLFVWPKEAYLYGQRGIFVWPKETYLYGQRGLLTCAYPTQRALGAAATSRTASPHWRCLLRRGQLVSGSRRWGAGREARRGGGRQYDHGCRRRGVRAEGAGKSVPPAGVASRDAQRDRWLCRPRTQRGGRGRAHAILAFDHGGVRILAHARAVQQGRRGVSGDGGGERGQRRQTGAVVAVLA